MASFFSIREYTVNARRDDVDKCWPFDPDEPIKLLPSMDVRKFRWWKHEMDKRNKRGKAEKRKRSISDLFASAPPITAVEAGSDFLDQDRSTEKVKKKRYKKVEIVERKSDDNNQESMKRIEKKKKLKKKKLKSTIYIQTKEKSAGPNGITKFTKPGKELPESDDQLPLISILKRKRKCNKKGKRIALSISQAVLNTDESRDAQNREIIGKELIDLNVEIRECIDLNEMPCVENETSNGAATVRSLEMLDLNLQYKSLSDEDKNDNNALRGDFTDLNSNCSGISSINKNNISTVPDTVRLLGRNVQVGTDFMAPRPSSSYASSSISDRGNNCNRCEMNYGTAQFNSINNYMPLISFPVQPGAYNLYHPQFPIISPPMISFPLGGTVFSRPYHVPFFGIGDRKYVENSNKEKENERGNVNTEADVRLAL